MRTKFLNYRDGDLVVITTAPARNEFGTFEYRSDIHETAFVKNGCSVIMVGEQDIRRVSPYDRMAELDSVYLD